MYPGTLLFGGFLGRAVLHQLNAEHQPFAANLADQIVLLRQFIEPTDQMISYLQSILLQVFAFDYLEHRRPCAQTTGFPPKVLKWIRSARLFAIDAVVTTAANGTPFPIPFAIVTMSGITPWLSNPQ